MADRHSIEGEITVTPPVTPGEIEEHGLNQRYAGPYLHVPREGEHTGHGTAIKFRGPAADDPDAWHQGDETLRDRLQQIVNAYGTAPDGTARAFAGYFDCVAQLTTGEGDSPYRVAIVDAGIIGHQAATIFDPLTVWPAQVGGNADAAADALIAAAGGEHEAMAALAQRIGSTTGEAPVMLVYGSPDTGFAHVGPVVPNGPDLEAFTDVELRDTYWWYVPYASLPQAAEDARASRGER